MMILKDMQELPIIVLVAPVCSGKSEVLAYLRRNHYVGIDMGEFLKELLMINIPSRQGKVQTIKEQIEKYGREKIISKLLDDLHSMYDSNMKGFVVCGMRNDIDMKILYENVNNRIINLFIYADSLQRYSWCKNRKRRGDPMTFLEFTRIDYEEIISGMGELVKKFEFEIIINNTTLENLFHEVDRRICI